MNPMRSDFRARTSHFFHFRTVEIATVVLITVLPISALVESWLPK